MTSQRKRMPMIAMALLIALAQAGLMACARSHDTVGLERDAGTFDAGTFDAGRDAGRDAAMAGERDAGPFDAALLPCTAGEDCSGGCQLAVTACSEGRVYCQPVGPRAAGVPCGTRPASECWFASVCDGVSTSCPGLRPRGTPCAAGECNGCGGCEAPLPTEDSACVPYDECRRGEVVCWHDEAKCEPTFEYRPAGRPCDDGHACTDDDRCNATGECRGTIARACNPDGGPHW